MAKKEIIGRDEEIKLLDQIIQSKQAEFIAVYGRRRVGKTFLMREYFLKKGLYLEMTGIKDAPLELQLGEFMKGYSDVFYGGAALQIPTSWHEAFEILTQKLDSLPKNQRVILFLDELPWMATKRSKLVQALDYYWNRHWSSRKQFILITCGSAASWMLDHLIFATGGLYNRVTKRILLEPFTLKETKQLLKSRSVQLSDKLILDLYMVMGGIPFYLNEVSRGKSASQVINTLCFSKKGLFYSEFTHLFSSLFDEAEDHLAIVRAIVHSGNALSREALIKVTGIPSGGAINRRLAELEASNFIQGFIPLGKKRRERFFRVVDEYTLFYLKWIEPLVESGAFSGQENYWQKMHRTPEKMAWSGLAFESVCLKHVNQIARALDLADVRYAAGSWRYLPPKKSKEDGAQVDVLFDRDDGVITLCEIKYCEKIFVIDKSYAKALDRKMDVFAHHYPSKARATDKHLDLAMISTFGVKRNMYADDLVHNEVLLRDLFR